MELDEYKIAIGKHSPGIIIQKGIPELSACMRGRTSSVISTIKSSLQLEIFFALLFLMFDGYVLLSSEHLYQRAFTFLLLIFCSLFIYYLVRLLADIRSERILLVSVREQLEQYIKIISRFSRLYFQLTMLIVPLIFTLAYISGYLNQSSSPGITISKMLIYLSASIAWSFLMYFFTKWYIKKLYGNQLGKLKSQLWELENKQ
jgi:hypothetical protein